MALRHLKRTEDVQEAEDACSRAKAKLGRRRRYGSRSQSMLEEGGWSRGGRGWRSCTCKARESVKEGRTDCEKPEPKGGESSREEEEKAVRGEGVSEHRPSDQKDRQERGDCEGGGGRDRKE